MVPGDGELEREGRTWVRRAISSAALTAMDIGFDFSGGPGVRFTLDYARPLLREVTAIARLILPDAEPVRVVAFDKTESGNWALPWHQDRVVALKERIHTLGYTNWTLKAGVWHAEPPIALLDEMLFARVHLDAAAEENGAMQIALGTHGFGKIAAVEAATTAEAHPIETCTAARGDVLFVKALTLHRSGPSRAPTPRRALRIDYCAAALPAPLEWETDT